MADKVFKILSIDGGGIKGLYSLYVLQEFEKFFCKEGETISDYFDLICGTSTGGLIALGIASGKKIDDIIKLYEDHGKDIFPNDEGKSWFGKQLLSIKKSFKQLSGSKYSPRVLTTNVDNFFGKRTMADSKNLLCIPSFQIGTNTNIVFKYPHSKLGMPDKTILMRDVALATSAAPTYFPPHNIQSENISGYFVDGGVWANNPSLVGITEAIKYFVGEGKSYNKYDVLSIGNINVHENEMLKDPNTYWNMKKIVDLIELLMNSSQSATGIYSKHICEQTGGKLFRIECTNFPYIHDIAMDNSKSDFLQALKTFGKNDGVARLTEDKFSNDCTIHRFFENKKTYMTTSH